jgi:hypothetical protein
MLSNRDIDWLAGELAATAEAMGQVISDNTVALMVADFRCFPKAQLKEALHRVRMEGTGRLTPKALLDQLDAINGRIGADEAFALVLKAKDETQTVVWTDEIAQAWTACAPMLEGRDQVGARMAFKQAYERIVQDARAQLKRPVPAYSLGSDPELRRVAIAQAHEQGRLPLAMALDALEGIAQFDPQQNAFVALGYTAPGPLKLLPGPSGMTALGQIVNSKPTVSGILPANVVEHIKKAREAAAKGAQRVKRRQQAQQRLERMKFSKRQREIGAAVQQHLNQQQKGTEQ